MSRYSAEQRRRVRNVALTYLEQNRTLISTGILSRVVELDLSVPQHALFRSDLMDNERIKYHQSSDTWSYKPVKEQVTDMKSLKAYFKQRASAGTPVRSLMDAYHGVHQDLLRLLRRGRLIAIHDAFLPGHSKIARHRPWDRSTQILARWGQPKWWIRPDVEPGMQESEKEYENRVVKSPSFWHLAAERIYQKVNDGIRRIRAYEANEANQGAAAAAERSVASPEGGSVENGTDEEEDAFLNFVHSIPPSAPDGKPIPRAHHGADVTDG